MLISRRAAVVASAALIAGLALSGCGTKEAQKDAASLTSATESSASLTTSAATTSAAAGTTTSAPAATPAGDKVGAADLPAIVVDRTYRGIYQGKPYVEYYTADGILRGKLDGEAYVGTWEVTGDQLCFTYPKDGVAPPPECYSIYKNGNADSWVGADGKILELSYVEGNPDQL